MRINTNVSALTALGNLNRVQDAVSKSMEKLSSGFRINSASDDAAGLAIANKLHAGIRSMQQAARNADQASSVLQVMQGGAGQIQSIVERMKELATQSNSDTVDANARARLDNEYTSLLGEIDRITATTQFNGNNLLDGSFGSSVDATSAILGAGKHVYSATINGTAAGTYSVDNSVAGKITISKGTTSQTIGVGVDGAQSVNFSTFGITLNLTSDYTAAGTASTGNLVVTATNSGNFMVSSSGQYAGQDLISSTAVNLTTAAGGLNLTGGRLDTAAHAQTALAALDGALTTLGTKLGDIGALQNRINFATATTKSQIQNVTAAESVIRDVDMAEEMTSFSKNQILAQAGTAMLAQANQLGAGVLQLLK